MKTGATPFFWSRLNRPQVAALPRSFSPRTARPRAPVKCFSRLLTLDKAGTRDHRKTIDASPIAILVGREGAEEQHYETLLQTWKSIVS